MKATHWMIAAAAFAFVQPASAGVDDTEVIIYRFPGVRDNNINPSEVTVFHCTNFSGATETLHMVTRGLNGGLVTNVAFGIGHLITLTASTRQNNAFISTVTFDAGVAFQGTIAIAATSTNIIRTAMVIDGTQPAPVGVALRGIRFNAVPGSQE